MTLMGVWVECPYCSHEFDRNVEVNKLKVMELVMCDSDEGGCDQYFVLEVEAIPSVKIFRLEQV